MTLSFKQKISDKSIAPENATTRNQYGISKNLFTRFVIIAGMNIKPISRGLKLLDFARNHVTPKKYLVRRKARIIILIKMVLAFIHIDQKRYPFTEKDAIDAGLMALDLMFIILTVTERTIPRTDLTGKYFAKDATCCIMIAFLVSPRRPKQDNEE